MRNYILRLLAILVGMLALGLAALPVYVAAQAQTASPKKAIWLGDPTEPLSTPNPTQHRVTARPSGTLRLNQRDGLQYVWIAPGTFQMGCSPGDDECNPDERPPHPVVIARGFWLGQTEETAGAYKRFAHAMGKAMPPEPMILGRNLNPGWANDGVPMVMVTWYEALDACTWSGGRLPTEAEWEYAARGGSPDARYGPLDEIDWNADNSGPTRLDSTRIRNEDRKNFRLHLKENGNGLHDVGTKKPNAYGLYDMLGSVWEWTNDWYDPEYYQKSPREDPVGPKNGVFPVYRGASWDDYPGYHRVSYRYGRSKPDVRNETGGFRCVGGDFGH